MSQKLCQNASAFCHSFFVLCIPLIILSLDVL